MLVFDAEFLRVAQPSTVPAFRALLTNAIRFAEDDFTLDDAAAVSGVRPAGLLHGVSASSGSPSDLSAVMADCRNGHPVAPMFVCSSYIALFLASAGGEVYRNISASPNVTGSIAGIPQIVSAAAESRLILIDGASIVVADGGAPDISRSSVAGLQLSDSPASGPQTQISSWQADLVAVRVLRVLYFEAAHADAVAFLDVGVGSPSGSPA
jgi:hypothetical protein